MNRGLEAATGALLMIWSIISSASEYPEAILGKEEEFVDISLSISKYESLRDGTKRFLIRNNLNGLKISFIVELLPKWNAKPIDNTDANFYWGNAPNALTKSATRWIV